MPGFAANFQKLKDDKVIPSDTEPGDLSGPVAAAIAGLTDDQLALLKDIADTAQAHIFLHEAELDPTDPAYKASKRKIVAMGL